MILSKCRELVLVMSVLQILFCCVKAKAQDVSPIQFEQSVRTYLSKIRSIDVSLESNTVRNGKTEVCNLHILFNGQEQIKAKMQVSTDKVKIDQLVEGIGIDSKPWAVIAYLDDPSTCISVLPKANVAGRRFQAVSDPRFLGFSSHLPGFEIGDSTEVFSGTPEQRMELNLKKVTINNEECQFLSWNTTNNRRVQAWFSHKKHNQLIRMEISSDGYIREKIVELTYHKQQDVWYPSKIVDLVSIDGKVRTKQTVNLNNVRINPELTNADFTLESLNLPDRLFCVTKGDNGRDYMRLVDGKLVPDDQPSIKPSRKVEQTPTPQPVPVASDNPNRLYFIIAGCVLLVGAIAIAFLLLRRKQNPT